MQIIVLKIFTDFLGKILHYPLNLPMLLQINISQNVYLGNRHLLPYIICFPFMFVLSSSSSLPLPACRHCYWCHNLPPYANMTLSSICCKAKIFILYLLSDQQTMRLGQHKLLLHDFFIFLRSMHHITQHALMHTCLCCVSGAGHTYKTDALCHRVTRLRKMNRSARTGQVTVR